MQHAACFENEKKTKKHRLNRRGQGPAHIYICTHMFTEHTHAHPQRPLRCLADWAGVVSFNDGEASASAILSGVFCRLSTPTWHRCRAEKRRRGRFKSQWWAGGGKSAMVVALWLDNNPQLNSFITENLHICLMFCQWTVDVRTDLLWCSVPLILFARHNSHPFHHCNWARKTSSFLINLPQGYSFIHYSLIATPLGCIPFIHTSPSSSHRSKTREATSSLFIIQLSAPRTHSSSSSYPHGS